ncbi:MAG: flagellar motor switch protein FliG, partial [Caulobacteraceae bacterium]
MAITGRGKKGVTDIARLNGAEKAAIILLALGEEHMVLWEALDDEEIKEISQAMSTLGTVSSQVVEDLMVEFVSGMSSAGAIMG